MTDTDFDENDISELRDYRELNMALMTSQPIWPNGWCQNVAIVAYTIKTERENTRAQDSRCGGLLEAAKPFALGRHIFSRSDDDRDTCSICGKNFRNTEYHFTANEGTATDRQRLTKAIAAFEVKDETI